MPSDLQFKAMNAIHRALLAVSFGRVGRSVQRMPALELTTTGRKSGRPHQVMLTSPYQEGSTYVVVASRGGDDHHPAWFLNLRDSPDVEVVVRGGKPHHIRARIATPDEHRRLWPLVIADHQNYAAYQARTEREIPLVLLGPIAD